MKFATIYFEDIFQFFSLSRKIPVQLQFYRKPEAEAVDKIKIAPSQSSEEEAIAMSRKKIQGEMFQYKHFESSDNVRRIVWKIYAKNRELMVRSPEWQKAYASKILIFADFSAPEKIVAENLYNHYFLNQYKTFLFSIIHQLQKDGQEVSLICSQNATRINVGKEIATAIAEANWDTKSAIQTPENTISLHITTPISTIQLTNNNNKYMFSFSKHLPVLKSRNLLKRIFIEQKDDEDYGIIADWEMSHFRKEIVEKEGK